MRLPFDSNFLFCLVFFITAKIAYSEALLGCVIASRSASVAFYRDIGPPNIRQFAIVVSEVEFIRVLAAGHLM